MKIYGLIGFPLKHSFSARFFAEKFQQENIEAEYLNFEIESITMLTKIICDNLSLVGLNVTIPYKETVIPYLDELDDTAKNIGAVNVIQIKRQENKLYLKGYNSDVIGFRDSIVPLLSPKIHKKALILGTGGAAKAVRYALESINIECRYVSRTPSENEYVYADLTKDIIDEYKVIVNASPLGTFPNIDQCPDIPYKLLTKNHLLYDLVYNPPVTKFLSLGAIQGATIKNGYEMLQLQALAAWGIWNK